MPAAVIYTRISKDEAGDRLGVDRQERLCRELADRQGLVVADVLVDNDVSASKLRRRPAFERLVGLLEGRQVDAVVTYHADRLYRRTTDLERLVAIVEKSRASVHTVAAGNIDLATASGRMVARMLGAAAQHEVERLGERMKAKHDEIAAKGQHPGGRPPFGYSRGYLVNEAEAATLRRMARRVLEGASLLRVARELTADEIPTREGRAWHHSSVRTALLNPAIVGLRVHRRDRRNDDLEAWIAGPGNWEPVLDRATWDEVRAVLADPARKRKRPPRRYLLSGLVESCEGDPMLGRPDRGAGGATDRRTYATRAPAALSLSIDADELEEAITGAVLDLLDDSELPLPSDHDAEAGAVVTALEAEMAALAELRGDGTITLAEWLAAREPLQRRLAEAHRASVTAGRAPEKLRRLAKPGAVRTAWDRDELDLETKRRIIGTMVDKVVIGPATRGRWTTVAERLDPANGGAIVWRA